MSAALLCGYFYPSSLPIGIHNYSMIAELSGRSFFSYTLFLHRPDTGQEETRVDPGHLTFGKSS